MAILNGVSNLGGVLVDMWINIISFFNSSVGNYALAIIILTVIIKLILSPLDFFNKKVTRKNSLMQQQIQPQLEKLQQKYGNDKNTYNQKMAELYKSNNYNVVGSCLFMLINLVVTFTVFISLLTGLNTMASKKITLQYETLQEVYQTEYDEQISNMESEEDAINEANNAVVIKYKEIKDSFLWIKNVWKADTLTNSIPSFDEYLSVANIVKIGDEQKEVSSLTEEERLQLKTEYELVMNPLREEIGTANGYFLLLILVVGTAILSQWLTQRKMTVSKNSSTNSVAGANKIMMFVLPVILGVFALSSNSAFSLYLLCSQLVAIITTPIIDVLIDKLEQKEANKKNDKYTPVYSRDKTIKK